MGFRLIYVRCFMVGLSKIVLLITTCQEKRNKSVVVVFYKPIKEECNDFRGNLDHYPRTNNLVQLPNYLYTSITVYNEHLSL